MDRIDTGAHGDIGQVADRQWRYHAVSGRDRRFDGQFWFGVTTTGIYCRPSCPARTPRPDHVEFFPTTASARRAGYRACKRCLPDSVPGSPEANPSGSTAGRALQLIADGVVDREGVDGLAVRLGYSTRQLGRILMRELGAGPLDLARAHRTQTARELLVNTDLDLPRIAYAAGFGSVRQFNDSFRQAFDMTPKQLRARTPRARGPQSRANGDSSALISTVARADGTDHHVPAVALHIELPLRNPYDARALVAFLERRAVAGVESAGRLADGRLHYARTLVLPRGPGAFDVTFAPVGARDPGPVTTAPAPGGGEATAPAWSAHATVELTDVADLAPAVARIRRLLDLDADPVTIARTVPHPGIRLPGAVDGTEVAVRAVVGQQISVRAATTHLTRLTTRLGSAYTSRIPGLTRLFPNAEQLSAGLPDSVPGQAPDPQRPLRLPARSVATVKRLARAVVTDEVRLDLGCDTDELIDVLRALRGVGPWTAAYTAMRLLGAPDVWLPGDLYLRDISPQDAASRYAPWRSYAVMQIWHSNETERLTT